MILMTDGFPEQFDDTGKELGYDRVREVFSTAAHLHPTRIIDRFHRTARLRMNGSAQKDDMTSLVLKIKDNPAHAVPMKKMDQADCL